MVERIWDRELEFSEDELSEMGAELIWPPSRRRSAARAAEAAGGAGRPAPAELAGVQQRNRKALRVPVDSVPRKATGDGAAAASAAAEVAAVAPAAAAGPAAPAAAAAAAAAAAPAAAVPAPASTGPVPSWVRPETVTPAEAGADGVAARSGEAEQEEELSAAEIEEVDEGAPTLRFKTQPATLQKDGRPLNLEFGPPQPVSEPAAAPRAESEEIGDITVDESALKAGQDGATLRVAPRPTPTRPRPAAPVVEPAAPPEEEAPSSDDVPVHVIGVTPAPTETRQAAQTAVAAERAEGEELPDSELEELSDDSQPIRLADHARGAAAAGEASHANGTDASRAPLQLTDTPAPAGAADDDDEEPPAPVRAQATPQAPPRAPAAAAPAAPGTAPAATPPAPPPTAPPAPGAAGAQARPATPPAAAQTPPAAPAAAEGDALRSTMRRRGRTRAWYEEVFDEDYLRTLPFLTPRRTLREVEFIEAALALPPQASLLDLGCGYGRHVVEFAARGYSVVGLDLSLPLLIRAADEAERRGLSISLIHADMRELAYTEQFDGAYCVFTTFGYFDDEGNRKVVQGLHRSLKRGGRLLLEVFNRDYILPDLPMRVWWEGDGCVVLEEVDFNYFKSTVNTKRSVVFDDGHQLEHEIVIRCYSLHELGKLLHEEGFRVLEVSGSLATRGRFFGADSRNLIVVAEKR